MSRFLSFITYQLKGGRDCHSNEAAPAKVTGRIGVRTTPYGLSALGCLDGGNADIAACRVAVGYPPSKRNML